MHESVKLVNKDGSYNKLIKRSIDKFINLLETNNHLLKTKYRLSLEKVLIDFNCGHEPHWMNPNNYIAGHSCLKCYYEHKSEEAKEYLIKEIIKNEHSLLSEYKGSEIKVLIDMKCNHGPHWILPNDYRYGKGCPKCSGNDSKQAELDLKLKIKENKHVLLSEYMKSNKKVLIDFNCGHEPHWMLPSDYKGGIGCPKCAGNNPKYAEELLKKQIKEKNHLLLSEYKGAMKKVLIDFNCGHKPHWTTPTLYKTGYSCPKCSGHCSEQAKEKLLQKIKENNHTLLSEFVKDREKVLIDFNCGHEPHWTAPHSYKTGFGCPKCSLSKGEKIINKWLDDNGIAHEIEYKIGNKMWRYDIYISRHNIVIEIQGIQHYKETFFNSRGKKRGRKTLKQQQEHDKRKKKYAESLGYNYIEVDYREHKPELALERFLNQFNQFKPTKKQYEQLSLF